MPNNQNPLQDLSNLDLEKMYPDLYKKIKPQIDEISGQIQNEQINEDMIESIVDEILRRSGLIENQWDMEDMVEMEDVEDALADAITVQRDMYGRYPRRRNQYPDYRRRRRYPRSSGFPLSDFVRLLLLRQLGFYPFY